MTEWRSIDTGARAGNFSIAGRISDVSSEYLSGQPVLSRLIALMSRFAAAPISRLRGLPRGGPADVAPVTADTAPATAEIAIVPDAPVARDEAVEASVEIPPATVAEVAPTVIPEAEVSEPVIVEDVPVAHVESAVVLEEPVVLEVASEAPASGRGRAAGRRVHRRDPDEQADAGTRGSRDRGADA